MSKHAHHDQIKQILKEEANLVAEHEFYSTLTTRSLNPEEEEKNNEIDEKLLENWKRWYAYKVLSVRFGDDEVKSELDNTIQSKITALQSMYYSIENDEETGSHELGIKAENFYKKEVAFLDSVKDYGV